MESLLCRNIISHYSCYSKENAAMFDRSHWLELPRRTCLWRRIEVILLHQSSCKACISHAFHLAFEGKWKTSWEFLSLPNVLYFDPIWSHLVLPKTRFVRQILVQGWIMLVKQSPCPSTRCELTWLFLLQESQRAGDSLHSNWKLSSRWSSMESSYDSSSSHLAIEIFLYAQERREERTGRGRSITRAWKLKLVGNKLVIIVKRPLWKCHEGAFEINPKASSLGPNPTLQGPSWLSTASLSLTCWYRLVFTHLLKELQSSSTTDVHKKEVQLL